MAVEIWETSGPFVPYFESHSFCIRIQKRHIWIRMYLNSKNVIFEFKYKSNGSQNMVRTVPESLWFWQPLTKGREKRPRGPRTKPWEPLDDLIINRQQRRVKTIQYNWIELNQFELTPPLRLRITHRLNSMWDMTTRETYPTIFAGVKTLNRQNEQNCWKNIF